MKVSPADPAGRNADQDLARTGFGNRQVTGLKHARQGFQNHGAHHPDLPLQAVAGPARFVIRSGGGELTGSGNSWMLS